MVPYDETPDRAYAILRELERRGIGFVEPWICADHCISTVHNPAMIEFLRSHDDAIIGTGKRPDVILPSDESVSISRGTYQAARSSAACAVSGAALLVSGGEKLAYALCRPPGHHAARTQMGGFCYFNNAAVAAMAMAEHGSVAIMDIDRHHGNGTQDIFYDDPNVPYVSINAEGVYPQIYSGRQSSLFDNGIIVNFTIKSDMNDDHYLEATDQALGVIMSHKPDVLVVSAGFDMSENEKPDLDELPAARLTRDCFHQIGRKLRDTRLPILVVQEGGYNAETLGQDVVAFLGGVEDL
jgi:acetoin utilization deacetylase AcuC-like enzyme